MPNGLIHSLPLVLKSASNSNINNYTLGLPKTVLGRSLTLVHDHLVPILTAAVVNDENSYAFHHTENKLELDPNQAGQRPSLGVPNAAPLFRMASVEVHLPNLIYASIILLITILLITTSITIISVILSAEELRNQLGYYLISLSCADLLCGVLITPVSIYAALDDNWTMPEAMCKLEAYIGIVLWSACAFNFCWLSIDRYAALHKPSRYEVEQTRTRSKAWIMFSWTTSILICCPTLFNEMRALSYTGGKICLLDWSAMKAYSITLATLVVLPNLFFVCFAYSYIFARFREEDPDLEIRRIVENDTTFMMTFFVIAVFALSWCPWFSLRAYETIMAEDLDVPILHFSLIWLAIGGGSWKLLIYATMSNDFRKSMAKLAAALLCCRCCFGGGNDYGRSSVGDRRYSHRQRFI